MVFGHQATRINSVSLAHSVPIYVGCLVTAVVTEVAKFLAKKESSAPKQPELE